MVMFFQLKATESELRNVYDTWEPDVRTEKYDRSDAPEMNRGDEK